MWKLVTAATTAAILLAGGAIAQSPTGAPENGRGLLRAACQADMSQHCQGIEAGGGRRIACLIEKKSQLSPGCQQALDQRKEGFGDKRRSGLEQPRFTLVQAQAQTPPATPPAVAPPAAPEAPKAANPPAPADRAPSARGPGEKGKRGAGLGVCRTDVATHCQNVEKGRGQRIACLKQNIDKLEPACRTALDERMAARAAKKNAQ